MARTKRPAAKRPPAHEVILARLKELTKKLEWLRLHPPASGTAPAIEDTPTIKEKSLRGVCDELLAVLNSMHLPEQERPMILAALRALDSDVIGVHRVHVHLLKRLSRHSPAHAMGQPKRRRA